MHVGLNVVLHNAVLFNQGFMEPIGSANGIKGYH